jgi:hypothetical protein
MHTGISGSGIFGQKMESTYSLFAENGRNAEMKKFEYKTVNYAQGLRKRLSGDDFGESFLRVLAEQGQEGWDLKDVIRDSGMQTILIFGREVA